VHRRNERGAAAVEFALVLPLLVFLLVGIAEFGRAYALQTTLSGSAREAVRVMALKNDPAAARSAARAVAPTLGLGDGQIAVGPASCPTPAGSTNVTVTITYTRPMLSGLFGASLTLQGKGVMRCGG
jgi:Flp pilus assembly protein TadG